MSNIFLNENFLNIFVNEVFISVQGFKKYVVLAYATFRKIKAFL